jgi:hypothetical protein
MSIEYLTWTRGRTKERPALIKIGSRIALIENNRKNVDNCR